MRVTLIALLFVVVAVSSARAAFDDRSIIYNATHMANLAEEVPAAAYPSPVELIAGRGTGTDREFLVGIDVYPAYKSPEGAYGIDPNDYIQYAALRCDGLQAVRGNGGSSKIKVRAYATSVFDPATATYATTGPRRHCRGEEVARTTVVPTTSGFDFALDVTDAIEQGERFFRVAVSSGPSGTFISLDGDSCRVERLVRGNPIAVNESHRSTETRTIDGVDVVYRHYPSRGWGGARGKKRVIFYNGAPTTDDKVRHAATDLSGLGFSVFALNSPGNGVSGDLVLDELAEDKYLERVPAYLAQLVLDLRLSKIVGVGQDFGDVVNIETTLRLLDAGASVKGMVLYEGAILDYLLCSTGREALGECSPIGKVGGATGYFYTCFNLNQGGCFDCQKNGTNWFWDPAYGTKVSASCDTSGEYPFGLGSVGGVGPFLQVEAHDRSVWDTLYCGGVPCETMVATQSQGECPAFLPVAAVPGEPAPPQGYRAQWMSDRLAAYRSIFLDPEHPMADVKKLIVCVTDTYNPLFQGGKNVARCNSEDLAWFVANVPNVVVKQIGGGKGHFEEDFDFPYALARAIDEEF